MQSFGNLTVRTQSEQRAQERVEWAAAGVQPRTCMKCAWQSHPEEQWCPKCGLVFAKARPANELPRAATPAPFVPAPAPSHSSREHDDFEALAPEDSDAPYYLGELRVLSMLTSIVTIALVAGAPTSKTNGSDLLAAALVLQLVALLTWVGARAYEWGVKNGFIGFVVLFFVTGWLWPLAAKPLAWVARVIASALPRATSWMPAGVLLVLACAGAAVR